MTKKQRELYGDIAKQALVSIDFARTHKAGKIANWQKNETLYYQKKQASVDNRANVNLGRMQEFVHSLWSKIDNPLIFKFTKRKESQLKRVNLLNALVTVDSNEDFWDIKDLVGKKQGIIYGRSIFNYYADSIDGYKSHLENIDVYDFLIDPKAGGIDIEKGEYCGDYSVILSKSQIEKGIKDGIYDKAQAEELLSGNGNIDEATTEETNKNSRSISAGATNRNVQSNPNSFRFWRWYETYEGVRYYLLMSNKGHWLRCEPLEDVFASNLFPYWTWAAFPDLTEFWTPSFCDYAREIFMAQDVSINQMLDNAEAINRPMKVINVDAIEDLAQLKYRIDGNIHVKGAFDANKAVQTLATPSINTPIEVFNILEGIQEKASGVTAGAKGVSDEDGKVGIYEGNQAAAADRFGLLNKSYSFGYKRFAKLYEDGVRTHLVKKTAVDILGPNGVEVTNVNKRDLFRKGDKYGILVDSSNAEATTSIQDQTLKSNFLTNQAINPAVNKKKLFELQAKIVGFEEEDIKELLDTSLYGNQELMSEAERDIESILAGETVKPNKNANNAYRQRILDYMNDHEEDIDFETFSALSIYFDSLEQIVMRNEARNFNTMQTQQILNNPAGLDQTGQPIQPGIPAPIQQNAQI